ncbi:MAG: ArnT family glycosyltransferase [Candidatus Scatovivens sp.]
MEKFIEKNYKKIILIICILGILLRAIYIIEKPIRKNQYDCKIWELYDLEDYEQVYELNEKNIGKAGHMYYIMILYSTFKLPEGVGGQYYHPPLHHFISAMWLKLMDVFPLNAIQKIESLQILSFTYSILILIFVYKIIEKTKINEVGKCLTMLLLNFFPLFIYMSGFINNDILITLFIVLNLYYIIKWDEEPNIKNTLMISFTFGLGMMTKTSMAVMSLPLAFVVLKKFIIKIQNKDKKLIKKIIFESIIFILIAGTLSLWFQIRKLIKYDSEMLAIQQPYDYFYSGDAPFLERWGVISKDILKNKILIEDKNIFSYIINSALYCLTEFTNISSYIVKEFTNISSYIVKESTIILGFISLAVIIKNIIKYRKNNETENILIITFISWILGFISFNISLPYSCTMNARYIGIMFMISMIMLGKSISDCKNKNWAYFIYVLSGLLCVFSSYIVLL